MTTEQAKEKLEIVIKLEEQAWNEYHMFEELAKPAQKTWHTYYEQRIQLETYIKFNETNP
jgi:hypothetical protein